jgi:hypothetical protein
MIFVGFFMVRNKLRVPCVRFAKLFTTPALSYYIFV